MENKQQPFLLGKESNAEMENQPSEMLKHLVLRWFLESQAAPLILQDGSLPEWFHGFITRKQAEDLLKDKDFGCFLIRLNERALGYVLSYRGKDRCRHFVISCQRNGHYVIAGDTHTHESLAELISYYQTSEIEPFEENLTTACSKLEEKGIYDEISLERQATSKQSSTPATPILTRQTSSSSSPTTRPEKDNASNPSAHSRRKLQEQQKSLSRERPNLNAEDLDTAPPIPDRSSLLMVESFEEDLGDGGNKAFIDNSQKPEEASQGNKKKPSTIFALSKQSDRFYSNKISPKESCHPGSIYSEIGLDRDKSCLTHLEPQSSQSSLKPLKKATLSSPSLTPPKLSPRLPNKPKTVTERQESQPLFPAYSVSLVVEEEHRKPFHDHTTAGSPKETMYGQINKMKVRKPTASACDHTSNTYEPIPFGWSKSATLEQDSEKLPKSLSMKPAGTYDQICSKPGQSARIQIYTENPYEKIPEHFSKGLSTKHVPTAENTYEQISFGPEKGTQAKPSHKSGKPRRFLFTDKKTKL